MFTKPNELNNNSNLEQKQEKDSRIYINTKHAGYSTK